MPTPTLVSIPFSPWSIRAKLALEAMGVPFALRTYVPGVSEPRVRLELRRPVGRLTLPVLLHDGPPIDDSLAIVKWGSARSERPLITAESSGAVEYWCRVADRLLAAGRIRTTHKVLGDPDALSESLPAFMQPLGPLGLAVGRAEAHRLLRKYDNGAGPAAQSARMREQLQVIAEALGSRDTMLPEFSYADVALAVGLSFVQPHRSHPLGARARSCWTSDDLSAGFASLLEWRDRVYVEIDRRRGR
ncbi:MAG: glutathione S-transferase [Myxococcota bacterium]